MNDNATWSRRPIKHSERTEVIGFLASRGGGHDVLVQTLLEGRYRAAQDQYLADRAANHAAASKADWTIVQLGVAEDAFVLAFRTWLRFAEATAGTDLASRLSPILGDRTPSRFAVAGVPDKVRSGERLFAEIHQFPELAGDAAALAALKVATATLEEARLANDEALVSRARAVREASGSTERFDRQYGALVKLTLLTDPDGLGADLPRFRRAASGLARTASKGERNA